MRRFLSFIAVFCSVFMAAGSALAYDLAHPAPGFGSGQYSNLISNSLFTSVDMTESDITAFLKKQGQYAGRSGNVSWLADYQIPEYQTVPYKYNDGNGNCIWTSTQVRQYDDAGNLPLYGMSVAALIAQKSALYGIAAEVILATLEKESSAISRSTPQSAPVEMWVLGFGWNDTMASCGYDQSHALSKATAYGGVGQQITYAMSSQYGLKLWYNQSAGTYGNTYTSTDGATFNPANQATKALYTYTPYVYNGNYNFWLFYNDWFSNGTKAFQREAQLVKGTTTSEIYAYWPAQSKRWYLTSMAAATAWGIQNQTVTTLSDSALAAIPVGTGSITRMSKYAGIDDVFYMEGGTKYHLKTDKLFSLYNLNWSELSTVDTALLEQAPTGQPIGMLARSQGHPEVYLLTLGHRFYIPDEATLTNWGYNWNDLSWIPQSEIDNYPSAGNLDYLVQLEGSDRVYALSNGKHLYIPSADVLNNWGLNFGMVSHVGLEMGYILTDGPTLTRVVRGSDSRVFFIQNGKKRYVSNANKLASVGASMNDLIQVSDTFLNRLATGTNL
jgi:hypothetical protein